MIYQQLTLNGEPAEKPSMSFQGGSLASLTALQESVKHLVMNVICGRSTEESLAKLNRDGLWLKMYQGYCQAKMDGSSEEYSEILPKWGLMLGGVLYPQHRLEPYIDESDWRLLPTPIKSVARAEAKNRYKGSKTERGSKTQEGLRIGIDCPTYLNPNYCEIIMGFQTGWSETSALETR